MKKIIKGILIGILALVLVILAADFLWINIPKLTSRSEIEDIENYSKKVEDLSIADGTRVIALGEATHGNADFQTLKLDVLKDLVENHGVRSFSLETDFGEGLMINDYIHGDKRDENISRIFSFNIYHTKEMNELINWMFAYNQDHEDKLYFYGIDMQNPEKSIRLVVDYCTDNNILRDKNLVETFRFIEDENYSISKIKENEDLLKVIQKELNKENTDEAKLLARAITNILVSIDYYEAETSDYVKMNNMRDEYMADNVKWISDFEKARGNALIFISGHNGHIAKEGLFYKTLGAHLNESFKDSYLAIGTDFYKTTVNINSAGQDNKRANHSFTSANPLAYQAKNFGGTYLLNFSSIKAGDTYNIISTPHNMGSLGEGYTPLMKLIPTSYRVKDKAINLYDAMIYVYEARPIEVIE